MKLSQFLARFRKDASPAPEAPVKEAPVPVPAPAPLAAAPRPAPVSGPAPMPAPAPAAPRQGAVPVAPAGAVPKPGTPAAAPEAPAPAPAREAGSISSILDEFGSIQALLGDEEEMVEIPCAALLAKLPADLRGPAWKPSGFPDNVIKVEQKTLMTQLQKGRIQYPLSKFRGDLPAGWVVDKDVAVDLDLARVVGAMPMDMMSGASRSAPEMQEVATMRDYFAPKSALPKDEPAVAPAAPQAPAAAPAAAPRPAAPAPLAPQPRPLAPAIAQAAPKPAGLPTPAPAPAPMPVTPLAMPAAAKPLAPIAPVRAPLPPMPSQAKPAPAPLPPMPSQPRPVAPPVPVVPAPAPAPVAVAPPPVVTPAPAPVEAAVAPPPPPPPPVVPAPAPAPVPVLEAPLPVVVPAPVPVVAAVAPPPPPLPPVVQAPAPAPVPVLEAPPSLVVPVPVPEVAAVVPPPPPAPSPVVQVPAPAPVPVAPPPAVVTAPGPVAAAVAPPPPVVQAPAPAPEPVAPMVPEPAEVPAVAAVEASIPAEDSEVEPVPEVAVVAMGWSGVEDGGDAASRAVDINSASMEDLQVLPSVGVTRAQAVVAFRQARGGFRNIFELGLVPGIGESSFRTLTGLSLKNRQNRHGLLNSLLGLDPDAQPTLSEIAKAANTIFASAGCMIADADGMPLAQFGMDQDLAERIAAIAPQFMRRATVYVNRLAPKEAIQCIALPLGDNPMILFNSDSVFLTFTQIKFNVTAKQMQKMEDFMTELVWLLGCRAVVRSAG